MAPHSSTLAWKIQWIEEPGGLQSMGSLRVGHDWATSLSLSCIGEGSGNPLQYSCLENPRDRGAWWAAIYGVAQSRTQLKWLSSSLCCILGLCHSSKSCALPLSLLLPFQWCFWTVELEKTLESPLVCKEIQPVNPIRNQPWIFIGRANAEAEVPVLWPTAAKRWLIGKEPDARKDWRQKKKRVAEDEVVRWHHQLNGHEFEQTLEDSEGQGSLMCCSHGFSKSQTWVSNWTTIATTTIGNYRPGTTNNVQHSYVFLFGIYYFPIETYSKIINLKKVCVFGNRN